MIKIHEGFYINEDIIAMVATQESTDQVLILLKDPIKLDADTSYEDVGLENPKGEGKSQRIISSISFDMRYAESFFASLDAMALGGMDYDDDFLGDEMLWIGGKGKEGIS